MSGGFVHVSDRINPNRSEPLNDDETVGELHTRDHRQTTGWRAFDREDLIEALERLGDYDDGLVYLALGERETQAGVACPVLYTQPHDNEEHLVIVSGLLGGRDAAEFDRWEAEKIDDEHCDRCGAKLVPQPETPGGRICRRCDT